MISDTLRHAISEIERYQRDMPETYDDLRSHINLVMADMANLLSKLEYPETNWHPANQSAIRAIENDPTGPHVMAYPFKD